MFGSAMMLKKKQFFGAVLGAILLMIVAHTIQKTSLEDQPIAYVQTQLATRIQTESQTPSLNVSNPRPGPSCGCAASCVSDTGRSQWFDRHYDLKQQPYLTGKDEDMDLKWWLSLQASDGTFKDVTRQLFEVISPPPENQTPPEKQCRRCAVVGNSGNLLNSKYGSLIDSHPTVIRMNKATTLSFEEDVGNRTTHHFLYPESAIDLHPGVHLVLLPFKLRDLQWLSSALSTGQIKTTYMRVKNLVRADKDKVRVINPAFFKYTHDMWTEKHGRYPSTGMVAIIFALHICDEVSVFGYGADKQGNWHHYWENNRYAGAFRKTGVHNADYETEVIQQLNSEGKIKLYT